MIAAGFGFRGAATVASLRDALRRAAGGRAVTHLAAPEDKAAAPPLLELARASGLPVVAIAPAAMREVTTPTRSETSEAARGVGSVAEAAALAAAGQGGRLLAPRAVSGDRMSTCAIATGEET